MDEDTSLYKNYYVSKDGNDQNDGSSSNPFKTISFAAHIARTGDAITVHQGTYREWINPKYGGKSNKKRIVYQAAKGEKVEIKGSERIKDWKEVKDGVWKVTIPNSFFGKFNPYSDLLHGEWFDDKGRKNHTGAVYLNGEWLVEAVKPEDVLNKEKGDALWFAQVDKEYTTIWAQFREADPNQEMVEINVRQSVFYPDKLGINFITVRGFTMCQAATPWAGAQSEQIGLIGTHWSKGWIIENNIISHSICTGITLGIRDFGQQWPATAEGYNQTIRYAIDQGGWSKKNIGSHIVRNNHISHCEKNAIHGSLGGAFSTISGNMIHDIHVRQLFAGADRAGIKLLGGIDAVIKNNHIYRTNRGIWLDWMAQGSRVSGNLLHDNLTDDLFLEVDHGPIVVDNNIFLSPTSLRIWSQGTAFVHNLITGKIVTSSWEKRQTPYHRKHSTTIAGLHDNPSGDDRFYNNVFVQSGGLSFYDTAKLPVWMEGNVFLAGAQPSKYEKGPLVKPEFDTARKIIEKPDGFYLEMKEYPAWIKERTSRLVTGRLLGKAAIPDLPFENADGSQIRINTDYLGNKRNEANPFPVPFEISDSSLLKLKIWPISQPK